MILITGITGMLGAHLAARLILDNQKIRGFVRSSSNQKVLKRVFSYYQIEDRISEIDFFEGELDDIFHLESAMEGIETCYHCAAMVSFSSKDKKQMMKVNVEGTTNLVNTALLLNISKFCHVSSIASLGVSHKVDLISEKESWKNSPENSNYAISKYLSEKEVWRGIEEGLNAVIVNPSVILGPGNWESGSGKIFEECANGLKFYTSGKNGFVDVRDVVDMMIKLTNENNFGQRFIITGYNLYFKDLFDKIHETFGVEKPSIKASKFLTGIAWKLEWIKSLFNNKTPLITKETAINSHIVRNYDNTKSINASNLKYRYLEDTIQYNCDWYKKDYIS
jgi:dihydroflavonol-4-reductase